jgi:bifunctional UDP-N-acetylglucosamine pyrophosphorylase / glucosamine-1-phosphate N-acetyltransferase
MVEPLGQKAPEADLAVMVLAAGAGTRMRSRTPKPLHKVAGISMLEHVIRAVTQLDPAQLILVASPELAVSSDIHFGAPEDNVGGSTGQGETPLPTIAHRLSNVEFTIVVQDPPKGTGDAAALGLNAVHNASTVLIVYADHPLVAVDDLRALVRKFHTGSARVGVMTCLVEDAAGYGRIERDTSNKPIAIVERVADVPEKRRGLIEINSGIMVLNTEWADQALRELEINPIKNEVFLTDLVARAASEEAYATPVVTIAGSADALIGVNDRAELAIVDDVMRRRIRSAHMRAGVTIVAPETVFIDADVSIGPDTTILPFTMIHSGCEIGERCRVGPHTTLERTSVGDDSHLEASIIRDSAIGRSSHVGPFSHIRNGTEIGDRVHIGNFVETKNARISSDVRAGHMSYLGDASVGAGTNIGAGTVTCNFDGVDKHHTAIGANVFVGSDSMLIAPVTIGDGAATGAGSVVTRDVEPGSKVVGIPARPIRRGTKVSKSPTSGKED